MTRWLLIELSFGVSEELVETALGNSAHYQDLHLMLHCMSLPKAQSKHWVQVLIKLGRFNPQWLLGHLRFIRLAEWMTTAHIIVCLGRPKSDLATPWPL